MTVLIGFSNRAQECTKLPRSEWLGYVSDAIDQVIGFGMACLLLDDELLGPRAQLDEMAERITALFRMEPGSAYPPHRHAAIEECWVIQGDLRFDDHVLEAGSYQRAESGSVHSVQSTENGCLLLVVSSICDERL